MANKEVVFDLDAQAFASDEFRIYQFKVKRCPRSRPHDWTQCPFAHPGEKAKRRDPRRYRYSGTACPEFRRNGCCRRGDACPFAHGVFECWLHPSRYRTQMCTDGNSCKRRVCFFAHCDGELRKPEEDPVWLEQQLQAELAAEQQQQQQQQALSILQALLGNQKPAAAAAAAPAPAVEAVSMQSLASLLGINPAGTAAAATPETARSMDPAKLMDAIGQMQQGQNGVTLLQLIDVLQKQQQGAAPVPAAAPPAATATSTAATPAADDLQAQLSKLLLGASAAPPAPPAATSAPEAAKAATAPAQLDVQALLAGVSSASTSTPAPHLLSALQQLLKPAPEPTNLLAALLAPQAGASSSNVNGQLAALLQAAAGASQGGAVASKPATEPAAEATSTDKPDVQEDLEAEAPTEAPAPAAAADSKEAPAAATESKPEVPAATENGAAEASTEKK